jgi:PPM family protein phosphatase
MPTVPSSPQSPSTGAGRLPSAVRRRDPHMRRQAPRPLTVAESATLSGRGRRRERNEDRVLESAPLFAVADGMGGGLGGGLAAEATLAAVSEATRAGGDPAAALAAGARTANQRVRATAEQHGWAHCGSTLAAALLDGAGFTVAHVGDSRAYLFRDRGLHQLTNDHSMLAELQRRGGLDAETAAGSPMRGVLTRSIGGEPTVEPDVQHVPARAGDVLLLCSDGLTDTVSGQEIATILDGAPNLAAAAAGLLSAAYRAGGDDVSVALVRVS